MNILSEYSFKNQEHKTVIAQILGREIQSGKARNLLFLGALLGLVEKDNYELPKIIKETFLVIFFNAGKEKIR